ncbi:hypothetical protein GDO81_021734 [Engystomops pustulosus]|uniref:Uncharacterized protein n=1 Tax=Engystomops pustulosus TaxID=76066 RepID=A0AAV6Z6S7_ENGPU|nr:hypothetical protein GDO81_021734 [Engystomops pustulosus]
MTHTNVVRDHNMITSGSESFWYISSPCSTLVDKKQTRSHIMSGPIPITPPVYDIWSMHLEEQSSSATLRISSSTCHLPTTFTTKC